MEEKKTINISLSTFLLLIALIVILILVIFICIQKINSNNQTSQLENNKNTNSQISELVNDTNNKSLNIVSNNSNQEESKNEQITEKQTLAANGYKIILYSNNEVKLFPDKESLNLVFANEITITKESSNVIGVTSTIEKMVQGNNGYSVDPMTFFIMQDGTVSYIQPYEDIINNNYTVPTSFSINKINNLSNVVDIGINSNDEIFAITKDNKQIIFWNNNRK